MYNSMAKPTYNFEISGRKKFHFMLSAPYSPAGHEKSPTPKGVGEICFSSAYTAV